MLSLQKEYLRNPVTSYIFPKPRKHRAIEIWQDKVFELLLNEKKIDQETVEDMADQDWEKLEPQSAYTRKCRMTWAALIKSVYEVDPLKCPKCGGTMKIISNIKRLISDN